METCNIVEIENGLTKIENEVNNMRRKLQTHKTKPKKSPLNKSRRGRFLLLEPPIQKSDKTTKLKPLYPSPLNHIGGKTRKRKTRKRKTGKHR